VIVKNFIIQKEKRSYCLNSINPKSVLILLSIVVIFAILSFIERYDKTGIFTLLNVFMCFAGGALCLGTFQYVALVNKFKKSGVVKQ
jgi:hypothetical protein